MYGFPLVLQGFAIWRSHHAKSFSRQCFFNVFGALFRISEGKELKYHLFYKVSGIDFPSLEKVDFPLVL